MTEEIKNLPAIVGSGGGGGGGGKRGGRGGQSTTFNEAPNTLRSNARARIVELLGEGEIVGLVNGARSIYFDKTPLQNADGSFNFNGVIWDQRVGLPDQPYVTGFPQTETFINVETEVKNATGPIIRTISDINADAIRLTIRLPSLVLQNTSNSNLEATSVEYRIEVRPNGGSWYIAEDVGIYNQKTTSPYQRAHRIPLPAGGAPWDVRVTRLTSDSTQANLQNATVWESYTILVEGRFTYPNSAFIALSMSAQEFGNSVPERVYDVEGLKILIPSNYNPRTRVYTGIWNGTFTRNWTNNPAWVLYDILLNNRYGLGEFIDAAKIDKWGLYTIARYCDELVPDGYGGMEPRFTFNGVMNSREEAFKVIQAICGAFRGMAFWSLGQIFAVADMPQDPIRIVTPANVIDGKFEYSGTSLKARHSVAMVAYNDPNDFYNTAIELIQDDDAVDRYGWRETEVQAVGITSRGQAHRFGKWILDTEQSETETVEYEASFDHATVKPGDVILVSDPRKAQIRTGGRLVDPEWPYRLNHSRNNDLTGLAAPATWPQTWTQQFTGGTFGLIAEIMGTGTDGDGFPYVQIRISGTTTSAADRRFLLMAMPTVAIPVSGAGEQWNGSFYISRTAGTTTGVTEARCRLTTRSSDGTTIINTSNGSSVLSSLAGSTAQVRPTASLTTTASDRYVAGGEVELTFAASTSIDITIRVGRFQTESGSLTVGSYLHNTKNEAGRFDTVTMNLWQLDAPFPVVAGQSYTFNVVLPDQTLWSSPIASFDPLFENKRLATTNSPPSRPVNGAMWVITSTEVQARRYRVMAVEETDKHTIRVTALFNDPNKYARVEQDIVLDPISYSRPSNVVSAPFAMGVSEAFYEDAQSRSVKSKLLLSWASNEFRPQTFLISADTPDRGYVDLAETAERTYELLDAVSGGYTFYVRAKLVNGLLSPVSTINYQPEGFSQYATPSPITNFTITQLGDLLNLSWTPPDRLDISHYVIKFSPLTSAVSWGSAQFLLPRVDATSIQVPVMLGTYLIKAVTIYGLESGNEAAVVFNGQGINNLNAVASILEDTVTDFFGKKQGVADTGTGIQLGSSGDFFTPSNFFATSDLFLSLGGILPLGYYYPATDIIDVTEVYTSRISTSIIAAGASLTTDVFVENDFFTVSDFFRVDSSKWDVTAEIRTTPGNPNFALRDCFSDALLGWTATNITPSYDSVSIRLTPTTSDPQFIKSSLSIAGSTNTKIRARVRRVSGTSWQGDAFYSTAGHSFTTSFYKNVANPFATVGNGVWVIVEWDMATLTVGGSDYTSNTITGVRLDLSGDSSTIYEIEYIEVGPNAVWTEWEPVVIGDYTARGFQFRLRLESFENGVSPIVSFAEFTVDMPDRVIAASNLAAPSTGLTVNFSPAFKELQGLSTSFLNVGTGEYAEITAKTATGFSIIFKNSAGVGVARTFDYVAKGYGRVV